MSLLAPYESAVTDKAAKPAWTAALACPVCHHPLILEVMLETEATACGSCGKPYGGRWVSGRFQPDLRPQRPAQDMVYSEGYDDTESFQNTVKQALRRYPRLYQFLLNVIGPAASLGPTSQQFVSGLSADAVILNIGAGTMRLSGRAHQKVIHLDYEPYPHLEVVGDAHQLPFADASVDAVICETMLEHVPEPERCIAEMHRVLRPGGKVYVMMPFLYNFHAAPNDYTRYTHRGFQHRMAAFTQEQLVVVSGPASALACVLIEFCAILFSFGSVRLYQLLSLAFLPVFAPFKLLDTVLARHPEATRIACVLLFIGQK